MLKLISFILFLALVQHGIADVYEGLSENVIESLNARRERFCNQTPGYDENFNYFYHNETGKCWKEYERGPCPGNLIFYQMDLIEGVCDCPGAMDMEPWRISIYHPKTDNCYPIFSQGPCPIMKWLTLSKNGQSKCQKNPCYKYNSYGKEFVLLNGKCVPYPKGCKGMKPTEYYTWEIKLTSAKPFCDKAWKYEGEAGTSISLAEKCPKGSKISYSGKCKKIHEF